MMHRALALGLVGIAIGCSSAGSTDASTSAGNGGMAAGSGSASTGSGSGTGTGAGGKPATTTTDASTTGTSTTGAGGSVTTAGAGGNGSGGGSAAGHACNDCVSTMGVFAQGSGCQESQNACLADTTCKAWNTCFESCTALNFTASCLDACNKAASSSMGLWAPIYTCVCAACQSECAPACP